jgi:trimeric autotransporter adhesin
MRTNELFAYAALAALLAVNAPLHAQGLGGSMRAAGGFGAMGTRTGLNARTQQSAAVGSARGGVTQAAQDAGRRTSDTADKVQGAARESVQRGESKAVGAAATGAADARSATHSTEGTLASTTKLAADGSGVKAGNASSEAVSAGGAHLTASSAQSAAATGSSGAKSTGQEPREQPVQVSGGAEASATASAAAH